MQQDCYYSPAPNPQKVAWHTRASKAAAAQTYGRQRGSRAARRPRRRAAFDSGPRRTHLPRHGRATDGRRDRGRKMWQGTPRHRHRAMPARVQGQPSAAGAANLRIAQRPTTRPRHAPRRKRATVDDSGSSATGHRQWATGTAKQDMPAGVQGGGSRTRQWRTTCKHAASV
jgi:hypothetical protein